MNDTQKEKQKLQFEKAFKDFVGGLNQFVSTDEGQWTIKGFIDVYKNVYTISADTKVISKILEIHLFPKILTFAKQQGFVIVPADHQNYYPDLSFVSKENPEIKYAVDFKTTYRLPNYPEFCNGFTLGSHGEYFTNRDSTKNIQFPYKSYLGHFCLGIIYSRTDKNNIDETRNHQIDDLQSIISVIGNFDFFLAEKWKIASDKGGSGNTANIGSIQKIDDIVSGRGMFSKLGERWFDDYWMNYGKITITDDAGKTKTIRTLKEFVKYRNGDISFIVPKAKKVKRRNTNKNES